MLRVKRNRLKSLFRTIFPAYVPKVRKPELSILYATRQLVLIYQVSSKYSKVYSSYRVDKKFKADIDANGICSKNNMSFGVCGWGGGGGGGGGGVGVHGHN